MNDADRATVGDLAARLNALGVRMSARLVPTGTKPVWRVSLHDSASGALLRVSEDESILDALSMAVAPC